MGGGKKMNKRFAFLPFSSCVLSLCTCSCRFLVFCINKISIRRMSCLFSLLGVWRVCFLVLCWLRWPRARTVKPTEWTDLCHLVWFIRPQPQRLRAYRFGVSARPSVCHRFFSRLYLCNGWRRDLGIGSYERSWRVDVPFDTFSHRKLAKNT